MIVRRMLSALVVVFCVSRVATADSITMNVDPLGTTSNTLVWGTVLVDGSAQWPARNQLAYRDYQFDLQTSSGTTTFDSFNVQLSAQLRNSTGTSNSLRATLWPGAIVANPLLTDSLVTLSTPNSSMALGQGYFSVLLSGSSFTAQPITTTASTFFFRVWAEGNNSNAGYQAKMAATLGEFQAVTMSPAPAIDGYIEYDSNDDGFIDSGEETSTRDLISEVPEPSAIMLAVLGAGGAGLSLLRRRRR